MKGITLALSLLALLVIGANAEAAGLEQKAENYLDKQAEAESNHKKMGKNDMNTDWMKNFDAGTKKKESPQPARKSNGGVAGSAKK